MHRVGGILVTFAIQELGALAFVRRIMRAVNELSRERCPIVEFIGRARGGIVKYHPIKATTVRW